MLSLWPICEAEGSKNVVPAPWSWAATSKALRVRVLVFSKMSAMFFPVRRGTSVPDRFACLRSIARSTR